MQDYSFNINTCFATWKKGRAFFWLSNFNLPIFNVVCFLQRQIFFMITPLITAKILNFSVNGRTSCTSGVIRNFLASLESYNKPFRKEMHLIINATFAEVMFSVCRFFFPKVLDSVQNELFHTVRACCYKNDV